ncbi:MAG: 3'-5' exonuclease [Bacteroidota bacterium]
MNRYIVFDLEATCWRGRPPKGITEIIEVGALMINRYGEVESRFERFVKPIVNPLLSGFCKNLTSISQENVDGARTFDRVIQEFRDWGNLYDDEYILLSWGGDDQNLLLNDSRLHQLETDWLDYYRDLKKNYKHMMNLTNARGLKSTVKWEGFEFTGAHHRAMSDAENLAKIFVKYLEDWDLF